MDRTSAVEPAGLRRPTCVEPGNTITYSLSFQDSYACLDDWVLGALGEMGIRAWYQPLNDIATDQGKIAGAVLRIGREKMSDKGTRSAKKRVDPLRRQTGLTREAVIERMISSFGGRYGLTQGKVTDKELSRAVESARAKFSSAEWTARMP